MSRSPFHFVNYLDLRFDCFIARSQLESYLNEKRTIKHRGRIILDFIIKEIYNKIL